MENKTQGGTETKQKKQESLWEILRFALVAVLIVIPIRAYVAQPFLVSGSSMVPTFENGDYLIVDEISYRLGEPERFDVIIFRYPKDTSKFFIKRIIGLPGETVEIKNGKIIILNDTKPEGMELNETYIKSFSSNNMKLVLEADEYFVMGDNRVGSSDSRQWGPVKEKYIIGRALLRLLPLGKIGVMPGSVE